MSRLIRVSDDLLSFIGTRNEDGRKLSYRWGEPVGHCADSDEWIYEPTDDGVQLVSVPDFGQQYSTSGAPIKSTTRT